MAEMSTEQKMKQGSLPAGVMLNAYPDSIGRNLADSVRMLKRDEFRDVFSLFYILPTIFHSDLDRGFSIIDYELNEELVTHVELETLRELNIMFKLDLVANHLSVGSPQFQDLLVKGDDSRYRDFFIDWNEFWSDNGEMGPGGHIIPKPELLEKLFLRKPGLPILDVRFPDGSDRPYWNTFYQEVTFDELTANDVLQGLLFPDGSEIPFGNPFYQDATFEDISANDTPQTPGDAELTPVKAEHLAAVLNEALRKKGNIDDVDLGPLADRKEEIVAIVEKKRRYLGQMDLNAQSEDVWAFYDDTLRKLREHGATFIRLDAFAYLHKQPGESNFFNKPGTWEYLQRLKAIAEKYELTLLPEIHSQYGTGLHEEVAAEGFPVYDFFFPGLVIDALDRGISKHLLAWIEELVRKGLKTVNMLGCHDGIPVLDLKGATDGDVEKPGMLSDEDIEAVIERILDRGGRVKNLYGADGKKISYYQVNATFFSALGEDERKLRLARAIQMFMPGVPQVWYLDLFAGKNDYAAADRGGSGGHKEINRTTLTNDDVEHGLTRCVVRDQLELMRLRNLSPAFTGDLTIHPSAEHELHLTWKCDRFEATLQADLNDCSFQTIHTDNSGERTVMRYC
jgi:sucrose phosphorylase